MHSFTEIQLRSVYLIFSYLQFLFCKTCTNTGWREHSDRYIRDEMGDNARQQSARPRPYGRE
jgi:hypothetical protein